MIKILLVDDHDLVRSGLKSILESNVLFTVIAEKNSGEAALEYLQTASLAPDIVLMDINMPGIGGIEATRRIAHAFPAVKVIGVTALKDNPFPAQLFKAGASGYITKGCEATEMFTAIETVMAGEQYLANQVSGKMTLNAMNKSSDDPFAELSEREMQVMLMVTQGYSNQSISDTLFLSPKTISTYRHRLFEKLGVANDVELTHLVIRHGIIDQ
jgi:two-component system invasion response regulator UvrY